MKKYRLFQVGTLNEDCQLDLLPFGKPFDEAFDYQPYDSPDLFGDIFDRLGKLVRHFFPEGGEFIPIDPTDRFDDFCTFDANGRIRIQTADGDFTIPNPIPYIAVDPYEVTFCVLFNADHSERHWIVVAPASAHLFAE